MAVPYDRLNFISKSDEDILNGFTHIIDFGKNFVSNNAQDKCEISILQTPASFENKTNCVSSSTDSAFISNGSLYESAGTSKNLEHINKHIHPFNHNFIQVSQNLFVIKKMYDSLNQQNKVWQTNVSASRQEMIESADNVISMQKLEKTVENMNKIVQHINQITVNVGRLKNLLRTSDDTKHLKIHIEYHKHVINFFSVAEQMLKDIRKDLDKFENCNAPSYRKATCTELYQNVQKLTTELQKSTDTLKEFKSSLEFLFQHS